MIGKLLELTALRRNLALKVGLLLEDDRDGLQTEWASALHWYF